MRQAFSRVADRADSSSRILGRNAQPIRFAVNASPNITTTHTIAMTAAYLMAVASPEESMARSNKDEYPVAESDTFQFGSQELICC